MKEEKPSTIAAIIAATTTMSSSKKEEDAGDATGKVEAQSNNENESKLDRCNEFKKLALENIFVKFVADKLSEQCAPKASIEDFIQCKPCHNEGIIGKYDHGKIQICSDNVEKYRLSSDQVSRTVLHEMIHAYDDCRVEFDETNCSHIACTEIRAALLSGDCDFVTELQRRNFGIKRQGEKCVRRRAELSVGAHAHCAANAKQAVEDVFEHCFKDYAPFTKKF